MLPINKKDKTLICIYIFIAAAALFFTWYQNILFMKTNVGGAADFIKGMYANHAAASIANDILFLGVAINIFMIIEAKRLGIKYVWLYILLSFIVAISVTVPVFFAIRQINICRSNIKK